MDTIKEILGFSSSTEEHKDEKATTTTAATAATTATTKTAPAATATRKGEVLKEETQCLPKKEIERVKEVDVHTVQPVVHRDREQTEIRQVVQPLHETEVKPTDVRTKATHAELGTRVEAPTGVPTPLEGERQLGAAPQVESKKEFMKSELRTEERPAVVEETVHKKIVEQVQPVVMVMHHRPYI